MCHRSASSTAVSTALCSVMRDGYLHVQFLAWQSHEKECESIWLPVYTQRSQTTITGAYPDVASGGTSTTSGRRMCCSHLLQGRSAVWNSGSRPHKNAHTLFLGDGGHAEGGDSWPPSASPSHNRAGASAVAVGPAVSITPSISHCGREHEESLSMGI